MLNALLKYVTEDCPDDNSMRPNVIGKESEQTGARRGSAQDGYGRRSSDVRSQAQLPDLVMGDGHI